jgi:hypothetical protein
LIHLLPPHSPARVTTILKKVEWQVAQLYAEGTAAANSSRDPQRRKIDTVMHQINYSEPLSLREAYFVASNLSFTSMTYSGELAVMALV